MYRISDSEWEVMRVIWTKGQVTSSDIITVLEKKQAWSASTIKTLLGRLVDKGAVSTQRQGRSFLYQAEISEERAHLDELEGLLDRICVTEHHSLLSHIIERTPMTVDDVEELQALLLSKQNQVVDKVLCDCVPGQCPCAHRKEENDDQTK
ncbi:CopY/TcrY family copper transport repressor [Streptococcus plurextorum]|uniref:CopY/TcrY family copper transport repressor n=1 Tax=Streptococcus plurextorum TaxID=456876 RepID=UPI0004022243|nr:CopY/TcrY family copper transport repressor [Streptococcus plurextorum]